MKKKIIFIFFIAMSATLGFGQTMSRLEREVLETNKKYDEAIVKNDIAALTAIMSDDYVFTDTDGRLHNKAQELEYVRSGKLKFESGMSDEVKVRVYGGTGVVTGRWISKGSYDGKSFMSRDRYTATYVKRGGRWQIVAEHATEIEDSAEMSKTVLMEKENATWMSVKNQRYDDFAMMLADDYQAYYRADEGAADKNKVLEEVKKLGLTDVSLTDMKVTFPTKDTALVTYKVEVKNASGMSSLYNATSAWAKRGGQWLIVYFHSDALAK